MSIPTNVWYFLFCQGFCTVPEQTSNTTNLYNTLHTKANAHTKRPLLNVVEDCIQNFIYYFIRIFCDFAGYFLDYLQYVISGFSACTMYNRTYYLTSSFTCACVLPLTIYSPQCARTDLNKRFLPKPMTTTG